MDLEHKKKGFGIGRTFKYFWSRAAAERETGHLRQEQKRFRTEIELARCEAEAQRREAGLAAFDLWEGGAWEKSEQELTKYFEKIKEKNEEIVKRNWEIEKLEEQIRSVRRKRAEGDRNSEEAGAETAAEDETAARVETTAGTETAASYVCPVCGASFHRPANFCRRCGSLMARSSENSIAFESPQAPGQPGARTPSEPVKVSGRPKVPEGES